VCACHIEVLKLRLQSRAHCCEDSLRDLNAVHFLEELEHLLAIELLGLLARDEVPLLRNHAAMRQNDGASVLMDPVVILHRIDLLLLLLIFLSGLFLFLFSLLHNLLTFRFVAFDRIITRLNLHLATNQLRKKVELESGLLCLDATFHDSGFGVIQDDGNGGQIGLTVFSVFEVNDCEHLETLDLPLVEPGVAISITSVPIARHSVEHRQVLATVHILFLDSDSILDIEDVVVARRGPNKLFAIACEQTEVKIAARFCSIFRDPGFVLRLKKLLFALELDH
jgi:hypothetical protein